MKIFDATLSVLERSLDAHLLRHNVLAGNLANADTPGFVPREVDFEAAMRGAPGTGAPDAPPAPARTDPGAAPLYPTRGLTLASAGHAVAGAPRASDIPLALAGTSAGGGASPIVTAPGASAGLDGNAVDVDRTLTAVAENALQYNAAARAAQKKLAILRYAASDGAA